MQKYIACLTVFCLVAVAQTTAAEAVTPFDVASVEVTKIDDGAYIELGVENDCSANEPFSLSEIGWSEIINIGEKVWKIIEANKPVVTVKAPTANALPRGLKCWTDLDSWQAPRTQTFQVLYKNYFGMEVTKFKFRLAYTYGGGNRGLGKYLTNVTVLPAELNVLWGYTFNAEVQVQQAVNLGTANDPVAGLELNLIWSVKTVLKQSDNSLHFFVRGDGAN